MKWYHYILIGIAVLIIAAVLEFLLESLFDKIREHKQRKKQTQKEQCLPDIPKEQKIVLLRHSGLELDERTLFRLFFRKDGLKRILFLKHKGYVTVREEYLDIFNADELDCSSAYGTWSGKEPITHLYDSEETALKEWQAKLKDFEEESLPFFSEGKYHE